jgi:hypothetical protein
MRSINQVRHFYVASTANPVDVVKNGESFKFKYTSPGGVVTSDLINIKDVLYAKYTADDDMQTKLKKAKVAFASGVTPIVGEEYVIKVLFRNYAGAGDDNYTVKYGFAVAATTTAADLYTALADSLKKNLKDLITLATVTSDANGVSISEVVQEDWEAGIKPFCVIPFEVSTMPVNDIQWAKVTVTADAGTINNGKKIADMEWFHTGARGDMYRGYGHPHGVRTKLVTDASKSYDTLDIHYAYVGPNEGSQKSEKTITIAAEPSAMNTLKDKLPTEIADMAKFPSA